MDGFDDYVGTVEITDLPEEVLEHIMSLLSPYRDYASSRLVCKQWYRLVRGVIQRRFEGFYRAVREMAVEWQLLPAESGPTVSDRYSHSSCYHDKSMYVFGGCTSTSTTFNDLWRFDLATRQWVRPLAIGTYPSPKACASLVAYQESLMLFGGWSHPTPYPLHQAARFFNQLHEYTPDTNRWSLVMTRNSPPPTAGHSASVVGDNMIVFGGSHGNGVSCNDLWVLDFLEMAWFRMDTGNPKPLPRYGQSQIVIDNEHILVLGGCGGPNKQYNDIWLLDLSTHPWQWREMAVEDSMNAAPQLWCHPACKVGDRVVVLAKTSKTSRVPTPQPVTVVLNSRQHSSKVWVPPRDNELPSTSSGVRGHPSTSGAAAALACSRKNTPKRRLPDTSESSSQESSSDTEGEGQGVEAGTGTAVANRQPIRGSPREGMPAVRPNAMKNRQRQLETLKKYEDRIKALNQPGGATGGPDGERTQSARNPMQVHVLDISSAVSKSRVVWQPIVENVSWEVPEETIFYSLVEGRGELVMFGGIQTDLNSMQRGVSIKSQTVSNSVHFLSARQTYL